MGPVKQRAIHEAVLRGLGWEKIHEPDGWALKEVFEEMTHEEKAEAWAVLHSWERRQIKEIAGEM